MSVLSPAAKMQFTDITGKPLVGGFLYTYEAGTTTPLATYTNSSGISFNPNPVILNARGEASVWLGADTYKFKLCDSNNVEIWTVDNIAAPISGVSPVLSGNVIINTDSSNPALTITQTGTGPVLRVQDSIDPDTTPFIVNNSGQVGIGTASPANALDVAGGAIQISSSTGVERAVISADATDTIVAVSDDRNFKIKTNGVTRATVNSTAITSAVPVVLPGDPSTSLQAATKNYVDSLAVYAAPPGLIAPYAAASEPIGWFVCDGRAVSRTLYASLFAAIGTVWGVGDGTTTFNIPDLRGMFLRGIGTNGTIPSAIGPNIGTYQADTYLNHNHSVTDPTHNHNLKITVGINGGGAGAVPYLDAAGASTFGANAASTGVSVNTSTTGGTETKPKNYGVLYIIKS